MNTDKRREREKIILEQAKFLIKANGFENTSMQEIASNCGLAVGTLYNYFPSKNDILISLIMNEVTCIIGSSEAILKNLLVSCRIVLQLFLRIIQNYLPFLIKNYGLSFLLKLQLKLMLLMLKVICGKALSN